MSPEWPPGRRKVLRNAVRSLYLQAAFKKQKNYVEVAKADVFHFNRNDVKPHPGSYQTRRGYKLPMCIPCRQMKQGKGRKYRNVVNVNWQTLN